METITRTAKKNINSGNQPKNNFTRTAHFIVHFLAVVLHDCNVKLPNYTFYGRNVVCVTVRLFFTAAHFLLRQHFFSSHRKYKIVMFFFVSSVFLTLVLALSLFSLQTLKFSRKKKTRLWCGFFSLKVREAMRFTAKRQGCLKCKISPRLS